MSKIKSKQNKKLGAIALEAVFSITLILPILMAFLFGGYSYYAAQSKNINLNFEVGRYVSTLGACSAETMSVIPRSSKYSNYEVHLLANGVETCLNCEGNALGIAPVSNSRGLITITCNPYDWQTGSEFGISTQYYYRAFSQAFNFFPNQSFEGATYLVE